MSHLNQDQLHALLRGNPSLEERAAMLGHVTQCGACAEALAMHTAQLPCAEPPRGMISRTLASAQKTSRPENLRSYSLRVLAAMAAALILLFSGAFGFLSRLPGEMPKLRENIQASFTEIFELTKERDPLASKSE